MPMNSSITLPHPAIKSRSTNSITLAEALVERWHNLPESSIPPKILKRTALCFEDTLAVSLSAAALDVGTAAARVASISGDGPATIWGTGLGVSAGEAAFANGMLAHALDFDDIHAAAIMHSSASIVPTAIALGERVGASGHKMLAAAIVGYEIAARLGRLAPGPFQENGFQSTAVLGVFAATSVASRLLQLDKRQTINALGIAGSMASGLMEYLADGSDVKQMHPGWAAHSAIRAAELAASGFTGPATIFEGRFGVFRSFARVAIDPRDAITFDGSHWEVEDMAPKPYPACLCVHPQVQAMLQLREQGVITPDRLDDIREIRCDVPSFYINLVYEPARNKVEVRTPYEGRFSAPFCMARALLDGRLDISSFTTESLMDPRARTIAAKVIYRAEALPEFPAAFPARVTVTKTNGRMFEAYIAHNIGSPGNPFTLDQFGAKFHSCVVPAIGQEAASALWTALRELPDLGGEKPFYSALRSSRAIKLEGPI